MVTVIGAINIDITAQSLTKYIPYDSNPGKVGFTVGGVGRNIACNLCNLSCDVNFLTAIGKDVFSDFAKQDCIQHGMHIDHAKQSELGSSYYICITDENGELQSAVSDMGLVKELTTDYIRDNLDLINQSEAVVFDTNLKEETICYILNNVTAPLFSDAVSCKKVRKFKNLVDAGTVLRLHTLKVNEFEAEALTGIEVKNEKDAQVAAKAIYSMGVQNVYITLGQLGACCFDGEDFMFVASPKLEAVNVTGAGDSFLASLVCSFVNGIEKNKMIYMGMAASEITIMSRESVSSELSFEAIKKKVGIENE